MPRATHAGAVTRPTRRRTQGAISVTVGKATGQVVAQLRSHEAMKSGPRPRVVASTKAETIATITAYSRAPNTIGAKRAGILGVGFR